MKRLVTIVSAVLLVASPSFSQGWDSQGRMVYRLERLPGKPIKDDRLEYSEEELLTWVRSWGKVRCNGRHGCTTRRK